MPSLLSRIFSPRANSQECKLAQKEASPVKELNKKVNGVAGNAIKELTKILDESDRFLQSIKDFPEKHALKNERNIMLHILGCDFGKQKIHSKDIKVAVRYCVKRAEAGQLSVKEKEQICAFFSKISTLPNEQFDRHALLKEKYALQRILSPELDQLLDSQEKNPSLTTDTQHQLNISIAKAKLSIELGFGVSNAGNGVNGAQIIRDLENNPVGVFKARPEIKWYQISEHMKKYFGQARLLSNNDLSQQFAEVAAYEFDKIMGFKLAPAATMVELKNREGAFLAFLSGYKELKKYEKDFEARTSYDKSERLLWQKKCLYKYLVGDLDPHNENIFVRLNEDGKLIDVRVIDHGNCFITKNPGEWGSKGNLGNWGNYKISKDDFEPEILDLIQNGLTEKNLNQFVVNMGEKREDFWTIPMDKLQRDRLRILRECVINKTIKNPYELAKVQTQRDYNEYLKNINAPRDEKNESTDVGGFSVMDIN